jgi:nitroreductase
MTVSEIIKSRRSVRSYLKKAVDREIIERVLETALRAPSWKNAQAYKIIVVEGETQKRLSDRLVLHARAGNKDNPDFPYQENYPGYLKKRMIDLGSKLYGHLGIDRKDTERRNELILDNFRFFGAPMGLIFVMEKGMGYWPALDLGILLGNIMIALREEGLDSVAQASLAAFPDIIREELKLDSKWNIAVGISLGYADPENPHNTFVSPRCDISEIVSFT